MATNLIDIIKGYITPDVVSNASRELGESENNVSKAINISVPVLLSGLARQSDHTDVMEKVMGYSREIGGEGDRVLTNPKAFFSKEGTPVGAAVGSKLVQLLLGNSQPTVNDSIAREAGVKASSVLRILGMVGTLLLSYVGKSNTSANDLQSLLSSQKDKIMSAVPAGLNLGFEKPMDRGATSRKTIPVNDRGTRLHRARGKTARTIWLWPAVIALLVVVGLYFAFRNSNNGNQRAMTSRNAANERPYDSTSGWKRAGTPMGSSSAKRSTEPRVTSRTTRFTLPNGTVITTTESHMEYRLNDWLNDRKNDADHTSWFNFDDLSFEPGKATLRPESSDQLDNVAEILKAYPAVRLEIGGYNDNIGSGSANDLPAQRAKVVKEELVKRGITSSRLDAQGYNMKSPATSNAGEGQNKSIAAKVTQR